MNSKRITCKSTLLTFRCYYKPSENERVSANGDKFDEKVLVCTVESRMKLVDDFRMIRSKMTSYVLQFITETGEIRVTKCNK